MPDKLSSGDLEAMVDKLKLVSEQSEREIAVRRACSKLNWAIKDLVANILRIIAGAGDVARLTDQIQPAVAAYEKLMVLTGNALAAENQIEQSLRTLDWRANNPKYSRPSDEDLARRESDGSADVKRAEREVAIAACRLVAAQIAEQPDQESKSHFQFVTAIWGYTAALELHRRKVKSFTK